ncbi:MAG: hypothetical protein EBR81_10365 [Proteobacteria bacterium]|nr:hypothetical protein [Pseudomonadota bacterium]
MALAAKPVTATVALRRTTEDALPKATVRLQTGATPTVGPKVTAVAPPKATTPLVKAPVPSSTPPVPASVYAEGSTVPARKVFAPKPPEVSDFDIAGEPEEEVVEQGGSSGLDRWLTIAAAVVALLSAASTFMTYTSIK